jgi:hypothetical protein
MVVSHELGLHPLVPTVIPVGTNRSISEFLSDRFFIV